MSTKEAESAQQPLCGADLERWRVENGLSKLAAAEAFGVQKAKWEALTHPDNASKPLPDPALGMLLQIYNTHPKSSPVQQPPDIGEFYEWLGLKESTQDRADFAILIGRATPSVWRLLLHNGNPGRPVVCWIEALKRLNLSPRQTMMLMTEIVRTVGERQGNPKVLSQGWSKQGDQGHQDD